MRASSLAYNTIAVNNEIESVYDDILYIKEHMPAILKLASVDLEAIAASLVDDGQDNG